MMLKKSMYIDLVDIEDIKDADCLVFAVAHDEFKNMSFDQMDALFGNFSNKTKKLLLM